MVASLSKVQIDTFTNLIEDNPKGWENEIIDIKSKYPDVFKKVSPRIEKDLKKLSPEDYMVWQERLKEYKKAIRPEVSPASFSTGRIINFANPSTNSFFGKTDGTLKNFMGLVTNPSLSGALDLGGEIAAASSKISSLSSGFTTQITSSLGDSLSGAISGGLASKAAIIFAMYPGAKLYAKALKKVIEMQTSVLGPALNMFEGLECVGDKVGDAMKGVIEDMLVELVKNSKQVPECASTEFIGAITDQITDKIDGLVSPQLSGINKILGVAINAKNILNQGISTIDNFSGLFKCGDKEPTSLSKYKIDGGLLNMLDPGQEQALIDKAFAMTGRSSAGNDMLNAFEQAYGVFNIFGGSSGGGAAGLGPCNSRDNPPPGSCGSPKVEFFGGGGSGAQGEVILGKFINKLDKTDIYGDIIKTASLMGVKITNPGSKYEREPMVSFTDPCNQGYGGYGRAVIDKNINSPTYGHLIDVIIISEGENYPTSGYVVEGADGDTPDPFIDHIICDEPGSGYDIDDFIEGVDPITGEIIPNEDFIITITPDTGEIVSVTLTAAGANKRYAAFPQLNINTTTGVGAILRPIMSTTRSSIALSSEVVESIDCITK